MSMKSFRDRRGMASLEFVLALPMLMVLIAIVLLMGRAGVARLSAITLARHDGDAWQKRFEHKSAAPFDWRQQPSEVDKLETDAKARFRGLSLAGTNSFVSPATQATSQSLVVGGVWDHRTTNTGSDDKLFELKTFPFLPHMVELQLLVAGSSLDQEFQSGLNALSGQLQGGQIVNTLLSSLIGANGLEDAQSNFQDLISGRGEMEDTLEFIFDLLPGLGDEESLLDSLRQGRGNQDLLKP